MEIKYGVVPTHFPFRQPSTQTQHIVIAKGSRRLIGEHITFINLVSAVKKKPNEAKAASNSNICLNVTDAVC